MIRLATISKDGFYRYKLYRRWASTHLKPLLWIMLNPSKADDKIDDATIRRCIDFSTRWGYSNLWVGNLFPFRTSNPNELIPIDAFHTLTNTHYIMKMIKQSDRVVCAWGTMGLLKPPAFFGDNTWHLGLTKEGYPKHPLYLPGSTTLTRWR